jgi:hypothetical protein
VCEEVFAEFLVHYLDGIYYKKFCFLKFARKMIKEGKAYMDDTDQETMQV